MADIKSLVRDPEFQALSWDDRHQVMSELDPDYRALSANEQASVMNDLKTRPWWNPGGKPQAATTQQTIPARVSFKQDAKPVSTLDFGTPRQKEEAARVREEVVGNETKGGAIRRFVADPAISLMKGAIAVPESAVGAADLLTGGHTGKILEDTVGFKPGEAKEILNSLYSPEQQEANQAVESADGFLPTVAAHIQNPSTIVHTALESAPSMVEAAGVGRGLIKLAPKLAPIAASAIGEGAVSAGSTAEQARQESSDGLLTVKQSAVAGGSGALTGALNVVGGKLSKKLGIEDVDLLLTSGAGSASRKGVARRVAEGMMSEGLIEETPQSAQEQIAQNITTGKPWSQGVGKAAASGLVSGAVMGGGANVTSHPAANHEVNSAPTTDPLQDHMNSNPPRNEQAAPGPEPQAGPEAQAAPAPPPQDVPLNTVFKNPDGSRVKITAKLQKEGGYIVNTTTVTPEGHAQTVSTHQPVSGNDALAMIEQHRPEPVAQEPAPTPIPELTRQQYMDGKAAEGPVIASGLDAAAHEAATSPLNDTVEPTQAQKEAGAYKKGHYNIHGLNVAIENPQGSKRSGYDVDGNPWETEMQDHYGYIKGTVGKDKDHVDVFIKPGSSPETIGDKVFVVDQIDPQTGELDEHKTMFGFNTVEEAREAYLRNYDQTGPARIGAITETNVADFKKWLKDGDTKSEFAPTQQQTAAKINTVANSPEFISHYIGTVKEALKTAGVDVNVSAGKPLITGAVPVHLEFMRDGEVIGRAERLFYGDRMVAAKIDNTTGNGERMGIIPVLYPAERQIAERYGVNVRASLTHPVTEAAFNRSHSINKVDGKTHYAEYSGKESFSGTDTTAYEEARKNQELEDRHDAHYKQSDLVREGATKDRGDQASTGRTEGTPGNIHGRGEGRTGDDGPVLQDRVDAVNSEHAKRKAEQTEYAQVLAELESKTAIEKRKGNKGFASTSDFREYLRQMYPSVDSLGYSKADIVAAVKIGAGMGGNRALTDARSEILDALRYDLDRLKEMYGDLQGDQEAMDAYDAVAEAVTVDAEANKEAVFRFFDDIIKENEREAANRGQDQGSAEQPSTGEAREGGTATQEEPASNPAAEEVKPPHYEKTEAGDQARLVKGDVQFGKGKNPKAKGNAGLDDMELFTEPKEREAEKRQGGFGWDAGGYAERTAPTRKAAQTFLELPEMVKLLKAINEGKLPRLMNSMGNALGKFVGNRQTGEANVLLRKDLWAGPQIAGESIKPKAFGKAWDAWREEVAKQNPGADIIFRHKYNRKSGLIDFRAYKKDPSFVGRVLAHEIGHAVDFLPDFMVKGRGNILGHIAALKNYMKDTLEMYPDAPGVALTREDIDRFKKEAEDEVNSRTEDIAETVTRVVPKYEETGVTPEMVTEIWNGMTDARSKYPTLYKFIAGLADGEKKKIVVQAMKGLVDERLKALGGKQVGTETITETIWRKVKPSKAEIKARFEDLVAEEIEKRRLYEKTVITDELKKLTQIWKPFTPQKNDKYTQYRHSAAELYADAVSVLFNEPQLLKDTAPTFYKAFFFHMGARPRFKEAYAYFSRLSDNPEALAAEHYKEEIEMNKRGHERANEVRQNKPVHESVYDTLMRVLIDKEHETIKNLPDTPEGRKARHQLEEIQYIGGEVENYARKANKVKGDIEASGLSIDDFSAYLLAHHIIQNRGDIANTQGKTAATEKAKLEYMRQQFGDEKMALLEQAAQDFRKAREHVLNRMSESGIVTDSMMEQIRKNDRYAHIDVQYYMDKRFGAGTAEGAGWKKMAEGTLSDINNVFTSTVLQDMAIIRMAKINEVKTELTSAFSSNGKANIASMKFNPVEKRMKPVEPGEGRAILTVLKNGKPVYYEVDSYVANTFKFDPVKAMTIGKVFGYVQKFFRDILVSKNPAWMLRNVYRDAKGTVKNNPEIAWWSPADRVRLFKNYLEAFKEVRADVLHGERSADIEMMHNQHMLNAERAYAGRETTFENEMERISDEFQFGNKVYASKARRAIQHVYDYLEHLGKVSEQTSKVAGMKYLRSKGLEGDALAHRVRTRVGTPDYKRQGSLQQLTNNIMMFSNVNKEGIRSAVEAAKEDPISYAFKTISMNVLPKLLLGLAAAGSFGDELEEAVTNIPSWDRRLYSVVPLPASMIQWAKGMGLVSEGATAYLRLPQDYEGAFWGALTYDLTQGDFKSVSANIGGNIPYTPDKVHPILRLAWDWYQYSRGAQPYDSFRQKDVLTREQQKYMEAKGGLNAKSLTGMATHTYSMLGLGNLYRLDNREFPKDQTEFERLLKTAPFNAIGSYLQVNDSGRQEKLVNLIRQGRNEKSIVSYEIGDAINESIREGKTSNADALKVYKRLREEGRIDSKAKFGSFRLRWKRAIGQKEYGIKPSSKAEEALMEKMGE